MANHEYRAAVKFARAGGIITAETRGLMARCVAEEFLHDQDRRHGGKSDVEILGAAWRKAHGFGKPYLRIGGRGSSSGYRERQRAEEAARKRKAQKASRVRDRLANGARKVAGAVKRLFRGASRGA